MPPNDNPNILGLERAPNRALAITLEDALVCLASRQPVFGVTVENSNVRPQTDTGECRVGRIPQGPRGEDQRRLTPATRPMRWWT